MLASVLFRLFLPLRRLQLTLMRRNQFPQLMRWIGSFLRSLPPWTVKGFTLLYQLNDTSHYSIALGEHERATVELIRSRLKPGMVVIDVGANIGYFSMLMSEAVGPTGYVISMEAHPVIASILSDNMWRVSRSSFDICRAAATNYDGIAAFGCAPVGSWSGLGVNGRQEFVSAWKLDTLVEKRGLSEVNFIKIDVEGAELQVLEGARGVIERDHPLLLVELHNPENKYDSHPVLDFLAEMGYTVSRLESWLVSADYMVFAQPASYSTTNGGAVHA